MTTQIEDIYYFAEKNKYYRKVDDGWVAYNKDDIKLLLAVKYNMSAQKIGSSSNIDRTLSFIQETCSINDVCALSGYNEGLNIIDGKRVLITESPNHMTPQKGTTQDYRYIDELLTQMLGVEQKEYFLAWLYYSLVNLRGLDGKPFDVLGQAIFFVGYKGSCKTLLLDIITHCLGGRYSDPHQYLTGGTTFNEHMFRSEVLVIDDKPGKNYEENADFSMHIKNVVASTKQYRHAKGFTPKQYSVKWRLLVALNLENTDSLKTIPTLDDSMTDKISLFKITKPNLDIPKEILENAFSLRALFAKEIPYFLYYLLNEHKIRDEIKDPKYRFGVKEYMNQEIMDIAMSNPAYISLIEILNDHILVKREISISFTITELIDVLSRRHIKLDRQYASSGAMSRKLTSMSELSMYKDFLKKSRRLYTIGNPSNPVVLMEDILSEIFRMQVHEQASYAAGTSFRRLYLDALERILNCPPTT
jgi:hypothetical protein